jgi:uncharacterized protein YbjQ (UPF0145 family)
VKNKKFFRVLGIIALAPVIGFSAASCATYPVVDHGYPEAGGSRSANIVIKDYQPLGIIFVKSTEVIDSKGNHSGSKITYEMLMREAQKLGADDVINVRIDVNEVEEFITDNPFAVVTKTTYNYTATALAVKYTNAVSGGTGGVDFQSTGNILPAADETNVPAAVDWRNRRFYLGGWGGYGEWYEGYRYGGIAGVKAEWLMAKYFSLDFDLGAEIGDTGLGVVTPLGNILAHIPFRFNSGWDIGILGGIFAGDPSYIGVGCGVSLGYKLGNGVLFYDALFLKSFIEDDVEFDRYYSYSGYTADVRSAIGFNVRLGYKIGLGKRK